MPTAEYMRAWRARRRAPAADHECVECHARFKPKRTDAAFCSPACRSAYWAKVRYDALNHHADSRHTCMQSVDEQGTRCGAPAPWRWQWVRNPWRHVGSELWVCEAHAPKHVEPGKSLRQVLEAARRTRREPKRAP
jgi:hypothetical protein